MPKYNNMTQIAAIVGAVALGVMGYNYYSQKNYGTPKTIVGQRATSDPAIAPSIQHMQTPGKTMSATEQSVSTPGKNATNRTY
jgi:uncharacterized membrane protein YebE (DUF533 family)